MSQIPAAPPQQARTDIHISGVYPHLTTYGIYSQNGGHYKGGHNECGIGAIVPWAGKLWMVNYAPHQPRGSEHKLFSIDPRPFQYAVDEKTAALTLAELELGDAQKLVKKGAAAANVRDRKQAERDQARAQLSSAQYELDNTIVRAPADGSVSLVTLRPGQRVSPRSVALNFISSDETWIAATIKQNGLRLLEPGQQVTVSFMSAPGAIYASRVAEVPRAIVQGQVTPEDASNPFQALSSTQGGYPVRIEMPSEASRELARAGSLAQVTIFTSEGNPINALAKILQWISTWADYVF